MATRTIENDGSQGVVTSRDPATLNSGELIAAEGVEYHPGSPHLYKLEGRTDTGEALGAAVQGIAKLQYDTASDVLAAVAGGAVFESAVSTTPDFSATSVTGLDSSAVPQFSGFRDRWFMCNGVDANRVREPGNVTGTSSPWRTVGLTAPIAPSYSILTAAATEIRPTYDEATVTGAYGRGYANASLAYDADQDTSAQGDMNYAPALASTNWHYPVIHIWKFASNAGGTSRSLYIDHEAAVTRGSLGVSAYNFLFPDTPGYIKLEYSTDGGANWTTISSSQISVSRTTATIPLSDGLDTSNVWVRASLQPTVYSAWALSHAVQPGADVTHNIHDIRISAGASLATVLENSIYYGYTEEYVDSQGVSYESVLSPTVQITTGVPTDKYGVALTLTQRNTFSTNFKIYRSVDEPEGGYPNLWLLATIPVSQTSYTDDFTVAPTDIPPGETPLSTLDFLDPNVGSLTAEVAYPPPLSSMTVPFQGCIVYVPSGGGGDSRRLYYSLPATVTTADTEKVPLPYYLEFQTPKNDQIRGAVTTNGGRSLLVFFENYTMLVNYLPQATDGVFDNRVREYVSNNRGCASRTGFVELTLTGGQTIVAVVDALGIWATNGVSAFEDWTRDCDWRTLMDGVDPTTYQLVDNTAKRRIELMYVDADGQHQEFHLYYGRLKQDGDGHAAPLHLGPTPMGVQARLYTTVSGAWEGFSGAVASTGGIFLEGGFADAANGYDSEGNINSSWTIRDVYIDGLTLAQLVTQGNPKFGDGITKEFVVEAEFFRDKGISYTKTKTYTAGEHQQIYFHCYADRHRITFTDLSDTEMPEFIRYGVQLRGAGETRDR